MWSSWVAHWGYHYRKKKKKEPYLTPRQRLFSSLLALWSLLLTSSVHVASLAMQPRLVELWQCRVQHLRQYYVRKHRQKGVPTTSCDVWYLPVVWTVWLLVMSFIVLSGVKHHSIYNMDEDVAETYFYEVMNLTFPVVLFLWSFADAQSEKQSKSRHYNSKHCYGNCVMCSHHLLRNGTVQTHKSDGVPMAMVVLPLRQRCSHKRVIKYIIPKIGGPSRVIHQILMQAGDVETNPGPECVVRNEDVQFLMKTLHQCAYQWKAIGGVLGFLHGELKNIERSNPEKDVVQLLGELLNQWCQWPTNDHKDLPTIEKLCDALRSEIVKFGAIANEVYDKRTLLPSWLSSATEVLEKPLSLNALVPALPRGPSSPTPPVLKSTDQNKINYESDGLEQVSTELCKKWPLSCEDIEEQLEEETQDIKIHYYEITSRFVESYLDRENLKEVCFKKLCHAIKSLFNFDVQSFKSSEELLYEILDRQSYVNFECVSAVISNCGTSEDRNNIENYIEAFKIYAKRRVFECDHDVLGKKVPNHETMMFILDEDQEFSLKNAKKFKVMLCKLLGIKKHQVLLHQVGTGSIAITIQIPSKYTPLFSSLPLFLDKLLSLQKWQVQRYVLKNDVIHLENWHVLNSICLGSQTVLHTGNTEFFTVTVDRIECLALRYTKFFLETSNADIGYIKYIDSMFSGKFKNLPFVKGVFYPPSHDGTCKYPTIIVEKLMTLKEVLEDKEVLPVTQISFLHDVCCSIASFEGIQNYQVSVFPDSIFFAGSDLDDISARFCPLYGYSFHTKDADTQIQQLSSYSSTLPLERLLWMNDLVKFIHFKGSITASSKLPEDHILKKMFDQKWLSQEDSFRPANFQQLSEYLQSLLETEKTWIGLALGSSSDLVEEEVQIHLILIGHTGVGKTSLRKHLKNKPISRNESPTIVMEPEYLYRESVEVMTSAPFQSINEALKISGSKVFLTMWDTGGQPIFQDLLPCFARLKCMYGIVFRLPDLKSFDSQPEIRPCNEHFEPVKSPFSNRDLIYRNLAYVEAFSCTFKEKLRNVQVQGQQSDESQCYPAAVVVGTCKDVAESDLERDKIEQKKQELNKAIDVFVHSYDLSVYSIPTDTRSFIHEIDNTSSGNVDRVDPGINYLRDNISRCAQQSNTKIPKSWKLFEVKLQRLCYTSHINIGIIPLSDAITIGRGCDVKTPEAALMYFHELGTLMWYHLSEKRSMKNYVVIDPKSLLDVLARLFCYNPTQVPLDQKECLEKGIVSIGYFRSLLQQKASNFDDTWFMNFLEEHHLSMKVSATGNDICYFLPSLLPTRPDYDKNLECFASENVSPLFVVPESGYIATGMFTRLLTALAGVTYGSTVWRIPLYDSFISNVCIQKVCRNQFEFVVNESVYVVLSEFTRYIQIDCICYPGKITLEEDLYFCILSTLSVQLQRIVPRWIDKKGFELTFPCKNPLCMPDKDHFLVSQHDSYKERKCSNGRKTSLSNLQMKWFDYKTVAGKGESLELFKNSLFKKSLKEGALDICVVTILFTGMNDLDCLNAKNVIFQEPISSQVLPGLKSSHSLYFRPHGKVELKRMQHDNCNEAILHALTYEEILPSAMSSSQPFSSKSSISGLSEITPSPSDGLQLTDEKARNQSSLRKPTKKTPQDSRQKEFQSSARESDTESLERVSADTIKYFLEYLTENKNKGKIEFFHAFNCDSYIILREILQVFVRNVTLSVLVASEFSEMELDLIRESFSFASKGLVIQSKGDSLNNTEALHNFREFLISDVDHNRPFFPLNYRKPQNSDYKFGVDIASHALQSVRLQSFPFSWYLFGFNLYKCMVSQNVDSLSVSKDCMIIAKAFDMDRPTVQAALEHLTENNVILYFGDILSDTVFIGMDKFISIFLDLHSQDMLFPISELEVAAAIQRHCEGSLSVSEFITLFQQLMILAPCGNSDYVIPCFLSVVDENEKKKICAHYMDDDAVALYFKCPSTGYEFISMLIAFLLSRPNNQWEIFEDNVVFKNCIVLVFKKTSCIVCISFSGKYIEVCAKPQDRSFKDFSPISNTILQGLEKIKLVLNSNQLFDFNFSFRCEFGDTTHYGYYYSEAMNLICPQHKVALNDNQKKWIRSDHSTLKRTTLTVNNIVEYLSPIADKWIEIAEMLEVSTNVVASILVSRNKIDKAQLRKVVEWWFKKSANPEWKTILFIKEKVCTKDDSPHISTPSEEDIQDCITHHALDFIKCTNWEVLIPHLMQRDLLDSLFAKKSNYEKGLNFYLEVLPSKGSTAYSRFYDCIAQEEEHSGHKALLKLMDDKRTYKAKRTVTLDNQQPIPDLKPSRVEEYQEEVIRRCIQRHANDFIMYTNWRILIPLLIQNELLDYHSIEPFLSRLTTNSFKGVEFFFKVLPSKGSTAYSRFYDCIAQEEEHIGHKALLDLMNNDKALYNETFESKTLDPHFHLPSTKKSFDEFSLGQTLPAEAVNLTSYPLDAYMFDYQPYRNGTNPLHVGDSQTLAYMKGLIYDQKRREDFIRRVTAWLHFLCSGLENVVMAIAPGHEATNFSTGFTHEIVGRLIATTPTIMDGRNLLVRTKTVPKQSQTPGLRSEFTHRGSIAIHPSFIAQNLNLDKTVIILDDVWTSGSTLRVCKEVMLTTNPKEVRLIAIGKTVNTVPSF